MIKDKGAKLQIFFIRYLMGLLILTYGCRTVRNVSPFQSKEYLNIELSDKNYFKFFHYQFIDFDNFKYEYCSGVYFSLDSNTYILTPDSLNNHNLDAYLMELQTDDLYGKKRFKIETNISCTENFKTKLYLDEKEFLFEGANIDTILDNSNFKFIKAEILLSEKLFNGKPSPAYKNITTKKIELKNTNSNILYLKIPIRKEMFYYKNSDNIKVKDFEKYYLFESGEKIEKANYVFDCD
jgi:hypothetical protein